MFVKYGRVSPMTLHSLCFVAGLVPGHNGDIATPEGRTPDCDEYAAHNLLSRTIAQ